MLQFSPWKTALIILTCVLGVAYAVPNFIPREHLEEVPGWLPSNQITLGLDLQGGSHLLLELDTDAVIEERLEGVVDDIRSTLRNERIGYTGLAVRDDVVVVRVREPEEFDKALGLIRDLAVPVQANLFGGLPSQDLVVTNDGTEITIAISEAALTEMVNSAVQQSIEIVRRRVDELGTTEPTIQRQGTDRILVQVPGLDDPARLKSLIGQTAKLTFHLVDASTTAQQALATRVPPGAEILYTEETEIAPAVPYLIRKRSVVSGENLVRATAGFDQQTNEPVVFFTFDTVGARRFGDITKDNVGRPFAIVLDRKVISAPVIREPILGGSGQISGGFTIEEANNLAILLRAGALPAPLNIIEERTVGPGLGADSIRAGEIAALIGFAAVIGFMVISYGLFGIFANIALVTNLFLIFGVLSPLQATLTLPGIAGLVLTIGMAVDANVLIFERIREEIAAGKTPIAAIEAGYSRALSTILDANITTFIAAAILFNVGSGPVRGFSVTLGVGILTSVFTAFTLTRLMVTVWLRRRRPAELSL